MNEIIISEFDKASEIEAVDGLALHIYSKGEDKVNSRDFDLRTVEQLWDTRFGELDKYITEWNLKASRNWDVEDNYGLKQAHELLNMTEEFTEHGVDVAHVWAIQQNNLTNLAGNEGDEGPLNVPGEMFRMMSEVLPNTTAIDLNPNSDEHEAVAEDTAVHAFYSDETFVSFMANVSDSAVQTQIDFSQILEGGGTIRVEVLGVQDGYNPTSHESPAEITELDPAEVFRNGVFTAELDAHEIVRFVVENPDYTDEFDNMLIGEGLPPSSAVPDEPDPITDIFIPPNEPPRAPDNIEDQQEEEPDEPLSADSLDDGGGIGGMSSLLGFLPLLALMGGF